MAAQILLRMHLEDSRPFSKEPVVLGLRPEIRSALRKLNERATAARVEQYYRKFRPDDVRLTKRMAQASWEHAVLYRGTGQPAKFAIGRAWFLLREHWQDVKDSDPAMSAARIRTPLSTAFDSIEYHVLFSFAMQIARGYIPDYKDYFGSTALAEKIAELVEYHVPFAANVVAPWDDVREYPHNWRGSPFFESPILRVGERSLISPDPSALFQTSAVRLVERALRGYACDGPSAIERALTMVGYVFEGLVTKLVRHATAHSKGSKFVPEFEYGTKSARRKSPECCVVESGGVVIFEAKASRYSSELSIEALVEWLRKLGGERENKKPLEQGVRFIRSWKEGDPEIAAQLGPWPPKHLLYVIVAMEEVPYIVHWRQFRKAIWRPLLTPEGGDLDMHTAFVSAFDLEVLVATVETLAARESGAGVYEVLRDWFMPWANGAALAGSGGTMRSGLSSYLVAKYPSVRSVFPDPLKTAYDDCLSSVTKLGFPGASSLR